MHLAADLSVRARWRRTSVEDAAQERVTDFFHLGLQ